MNQEHLAKLWRAIGAVLLFYSLNSYLATQGGETVFSVKLFVKAREPIALFGIIIGAPLLFLGAVVGRSFASRSGPTWHNRIPVVWFNEIDTASSEGRWYQRIMIVGLTILPALSLIHFFLIVEAASVCVRSSPARTTNVWDWSALETLDDPTRIGGILNRAAQPPICENGVTFFPVVEPLVLLVLILAAYWAVYRQFCAIWR